MMYRLFFLAFITSLIIPELSAQGLNFDDADYEQVPMARNLKHSLHTAKIAAKASLKTFAPKARDQGSYNNCVGWSTAYAARTIAEAQQHGWSREQATQHAFSPGFIYKLISPDASCNTPVSIEEAMRAMQRKGAAKFSDVNQVCPDRLSPQLMRQAAPYKIKRFERLFYLKAKGKDKIQPVKLALSEGKPVVFGMRCPPSFEKADEVAVWTPLEPAHTKTYFGHAMCVVGYDDHRYGGAFEVLNSWGSRFGKNGFIWIRYQDFAAFTKYGFVFEATANARPGPELATTSPKPASPKAAGWSDFSGQAQLVDLKGNPIPLRRSGNRYLATGITAQSNLVQLRIKSRQGAYVYVLKPGHGGRVHLLFPQYGQADVQIAPGQATRIPIRNPLNATDAEGLWVLFSPQPLSLDKLLLGLGQHRGSFSQRLYRALEEDWVPYKQVQYQRSQAAFQARATGKGIVPLWLKSG